MRIYALHVYMYIIWICVCRVATPVIDISKKRDQKIHVCAVDVLCRGVDSSVDSLDDQSQPSTFISLSYTWVSDLSSLIAQHNIHA